MLSVGYSIFFILQLYTQCPEDQFIFSDGQPAGNIIYLGLYESERDWSNYTKPKVSRVYVTDISSVSHPVTGSLITLQQTNNNIKFIGHLIIQ